MRIHNIVGIYTIHYFLNIHPIQIEEIIQDL